MKKEFRIKKNKEIENILNYKKSIGNEYFKIFIYKNNETSHFRYAISVGKKIGNAVIRNKEKRRLRMLFLEYSKKINKNYDFFLIAKPKIKDLNYKELETLFFKYINKIITKEKNSEIISI